MYQNLRAFADPLREPISHSGNPQAHEVETLLDSSALHVASAAFGAKLDDAWNAHGSDLQALFPDVAPHLSAATLVFVGAVSALDQCAAALARWSGDLHRSDRECDMGCVLDTRRAHTRATWGDRWLTDTVDDDRWTPIKDARDHLAHRVLSRSAVAGGRPTFALRPLTPSEATKRRVRDKAAALGIRPERWEQFVAQREQAAERTVDQWYGDAVNVAVERWRAFWTALADDARTTRTR